MDSRQLINMKFVYFIFLTIAAPILQAQEAVSQLRTETSKVDTNTPIPVFRIDSKKIDPFGLYQNPDDIPKQSVAAPAPSAQKALEAPALKEVITGLKIHGVSPARGEFIIGLNRFKLGQTIQLTKKIKVKVLDITNNSVSFEDINNRDKATLTLRDTNLFQKHKKADDSLLQFSQENAPLLNE